MRTKLRYWLEVLSVIQEFPALVHMLQKLQVLVAVSQLTVYGT